jgi:hypothetical protein
LVVSSSKPSEGFGGFGLKTIEGRFAGLGLKTRRGRFGGLSLKTTEWMVSRVCPKNTGEGSEEERSGTWWNHRGCVKAKQICAGSVAIRSTEKELDHYALRSSGSAQNS